MAQTVKNLPPSAGDLGSVPAGEDPLEKGMATHSSILAWRIPRTEESGGLQFMGSQTVRHDRATNSLALPEKRGNGLKSFRLWYVSMPESEK